MNMKDKTKEKLVYVLVAATIIPGGIIFLGGLSLINKIYKEVKQEKINKNATKTDNK